MNAMVFALTCRRFFTVTALALVSACWLTIAARAELSLQVDPKPLATELKAKTSFAPMLKQVSRSIVSIYTTKVVRPDQMMSPFGNPMFPFFGDGQMRPRRESGLGSGVILTADGYIVTNNHVVAGADEIKVALAGEERELTAKLIGTDPKTDIAVLKVDAKALPAITLTDSDSLEIGDAVFAIGNPFGVGQTITSGIVSAISRGNLGITDYEDFIQTDASINPGNSGGALVDAQGRLVGINTAILSRTGGNNGIGFAVPSNLARNILERLVSHGRVVRGYLGVVIQGVDQNLAAKFNLKDTKGALVNEVTPDSAAAAAGIQAGDVIISFSGTKVDDVRHLRLMAARTPPGQTVPVIVLRDGKEKKLSVTLKELPDEAEAGTPGGGDEGGPGEAILNGVRLQELNPQMRTALRIPDGIEGALIADVDPLSPATEAGLRQGDVLLEIERQPVRSARDAVRILRKVKGESVLLYVWSPQGKRYVAVNLKP
jgi:serine protease Do